MAITLKIGNFHLFKPIPEVGAEVQIGLSEQKYILSIMAAVGACVIFFIAILKAGRLNINDAPWFSGVVLIVELLVYLFLKAWFKYIATRTYIEINHSGITYKGGLILWNELESFCIRITCYDEGGDKEQLLLTAKDNRLSKTIDYDDLNTNMQHLRQCIISINTNPDLEDHGIQRI